MLVYTTTYRITGASHFLPKMTAETMRCSSDFPKIERQSYKATGYQSLTAELPRLVKPLLKH